VRKDRLSKDCGTKPACHGQLAPPVPAAPISHPPPSSPTGSAPNADQANPTIRKSSSLPESENSTVGWAGVQEQDAGPLMEITINHLVSGERSTKQRLRLGRSIRARRWLLYGNHDEWSGETSYLMFGNNGRGRMRDMLAGGRREEATCPTFLIFIHIEFLIAKSWQRFRTTSFWRRGHTGVLCWDASRSGDIRKTSSERSTRTAWYTRLT